MMIGIVRFAIFDLRLPISEGANRQVLEIYAAAARRLTQRTINPAAAWGK